MENHASIRRPPRVSIGMPVRNGEAFIRPAVESLLAQTCPDFELIICDNASTDQTESICRSLAQSDSRVRYVRNEQNIGLENFNRVLRLARGPYFMWAAHDDVWEPDFVAELASLLDQEPNAALAFCAFDSIDSQENRVDCFDLSALAHADLVNRLSAFVGHTEERGKANLIYGLMRRELLVKAEGFRLWDGLYGADMLVVFRLLSLGGLVLSPRRLFHKRLSRADAVPVPDCGKRVTTIQHVWHQFRQTRQYISSYETLISMVDGLSAIERLRLRALVQARKTRLLIKTSHRDVRHRLRFVPRMLSSVVKRTPLDSVRLRLREHRRIARWRERGSPVPPPSALKHSVIKQYAREFRLETLIETGTYQGETVQACRFQFRRIFSIELDAQLHRRAVQRFQRQRHVTILRGDSARVLPAILEQLRQPAIFWLDAHYSGGITARGELDTPIQSELATILDHRIKDHVILIDDAREFGRDAGYPALDALQAFLAKVRPGWVFEVRDDIIRFHPLALRTESQAA